MAELFVIALAVVFGLGCLGVLAAAGYTLIVLAGGACLGGFIVLVACIMFSDKRKERENQRLAEERQWMLDLIMAARSSASAQSLNEIFSVEQDKPRRLPKRG